MGAAHAEDMRQGKTFQLRTSLALSWVMWVSYLLLSIVPLCQGQMVRLCPGIGIDSMAWIVVVRDMVVMLVEELHVEMERWM